MTAAASAPLVGFRAFAVWQPATDITPQLSAITATTEPWRTGKNTAACRNHSTAYRTGDRKHSKPLRSCSCGFHAFATLGDLLAARENHGHVYAAVIGYGKVIEHRDGWRAEHSQIVALIAAPDLRLAAIAKHYAVPIVTIDNVLTVAAEFGDVRPELPPLRVHDRAPSGDQLLTGRSGIVRDRLKLQRNTYARRVSNGDVVIRLHSTDVVTIHPDGSRTLHSGGWHTMTTRDRLETYGGVRIWSDHGDWLVNGLHLFRDGMTVAAAAAD